MADAAPDAARAKVSPPLQKQTCEVRWIRPGRVGGEVSEWFSQFSQVRETREDDYLVAPRLPGLSVKIRGGASFDVKQHRGAAGALDLGGGPVRIDSWFKLSFPLAGVVQAAYPPERSAWRRVLKRRRIAPFPIGDAHGQTGAPESAVCSVELTEVEALGREWWTLAFEADGAEAFEGIRRTAATVTAQPLPADLEFGPGEARSYSEWVHELEGPNMP